MIRQIDDVYALFRLNEGIAVSENIELSRTRAHFLQIGFEFLDQSIVWRNCHHRHLDIDQSQWAVFQFTRCIAFSVNVGDFFELERTFHRDRPVNAASQEQGMIFIHEGLRPLDNLWLQRQDLLHCCRQMAQLFEIVFFFINRQAPFNFRQYQRQHEQ